MPAPILHIHPQDNVAVALADLAAGTLLPIEGKEITLAQEIKRGHKIAIHTITQEAHVLKFGYPIGHATAEIQPGHWVHTHNVKTNLEGLLDYQYEPSPIKPLPTTPPETFMGYLRDNGEVGIRNEIWVLPMVGCVNKVADAIVREAHRELSGGTLEGIYTFPHPYGCSQLGDDHENTQKILARLAQHPNAGGILMLGLGCENNTMKSFKEILGPYDEKRIRFLTSQEVDDEVSSAMAILRELAAHVKTFHRQPVPASKLCIGLKCGGSDGFSGITANPLTGRISDLLVARGGTTILTEVPEMFGAETILMNRCASHDTFNQCVAMINGFKAYFQRYNQVIYENPSPGNKDGGITTLEEKSLGCTQKGGTSTVVAILPYASKATVPGLNLLNGPGNDIVAVTALAAAGAHIVLFTTGRGTPLGGPVPTIKIATNTPLSQNKPRWIDFNAGILLEGQSMDEVAHTFFQQILQTASGTLRTRNEENDYREIAIFKDGVTL